MKRYTRKHYNKKLVALGLAAFMGIGLTSTGFAAWVMSQNAKEEVSGNVNVSTMTDASVSIKIYQSDNLGAIWQKDGADATHSGINSGYIGTESRNLAELTTAGYSRKELTKTDNKYKTTDNFVFDAAVGDKEGRLRVSEEPGAGEDLEVKIFGTLEEKSGVDYTLTAAVEIPASIHNAILEGYLKTDMTMVKEKKEGETLISATYEIADIEYSTVTGYENDFVVTISFTWGTAFGGVNPSLYYDEHQTGKEVSDAQMKTDMGTFWNTITGKTFDWSADEPMTYQGNFNVVLSASPKEV